MNKEERILHEFACMMYDLAEINWDMLNEKGCEAFLRSKETIFTENQKKDVLDLYNNFIEIHNKYKE